MKYGVHALRLRGAPLTLLSFQHAAPRSRVGIVDLRDRQMQPLAVLRRHLLQQLSVIGDAFQEFGYAARKRSSSG